MNGRNCLITGAARGLGMAMHKALGGTAFVRGDRLVAPGEPYEAIVHCAVNSAKAVRLDEAYAYFQDNVLLTQELVRLPHKRFVYISSIDVYERGQTPCRAEANPEAPQFAGLYASSKLFSEAMVRAEGVRPLILRPTTLMGPGMRPNSTYRMLTEPVCKLFLAPESRFNYVNHRDVCDFVALALARDIAGVFNIASSSSITLGEVAGQLGLAPRFGEHCYDVGAIDQGPAAEILPAFARSSAQALNAFIDEIGAEYIGRGRLAL